MTGIVVFCQNGMPFFAIYARELCCSGVTGDQRSVQD